MGIPCLKRDLLQCQKRPTPVSKETYSSVKRDRTSERLDLALLVTLGRCYAAKLEDARDDET